MGWLSIFLRQVKYGLYNIQAWLDDAIYIGSELGGFGIIKRGVFG